MKYCIQGKTAMSGETAHMCLLYDLLWYVSDSSPNSA
jgi:hypothetical protein